MAKRLAAMGAALTGSALLMACVVGIVAASSTAPSNLTLTPSGDTFRLEWTKATDSAYSQAHLIGFWKSGEPGNATAALVKGGVNSVTFPPDKLDSGTMYKFQVFSLKTDENGQPVRDADRNDDYVYGGSTNVVSHTTSGTSGSSDTDPNATDFTISQSGSTAVLSWTPGNDSRISYQRIMRRTRGSAWTAIRVSSDTNSYTDNGVESGKKYIYRIESWSSKNKKIGLSRPAKITMR